MSLTADRTDERLSNDELRSLFLFESLTDEQLTWLGERGWVGFGKSAEGHGTHVLRYRLERLGG